MSTRNEFATEMRKMLLGLDWVARHRVWTRYKAWAAFQASRRRDVELIRTSMSSHDLIDGEGDGVDVVPMVVIAMPRPPRKSVQMKISDYFPKAKKKTKRGIQLKLTSFFKTRTQ